MGLKTIRKERDLTLDELAAMSGVAASTIGNFENGKTNMSPEYLKRIAIALKVSENELIPEEVLNEDTLPYRVESVGEDWKARAIEAETKLEAIRRMLHKLDQPKTKVPLSSAEPSGAAALLQRAAGEGKHRPAK